MQLQLANCECSDLSDGVWAGGAGASVGLQGLCIPLGRGLTPGFIRPVLRDWLHTHTHTYTDLEQYTIPPSMFTHNDQAAVYKLFCMQLAIVLSSFDQQLCRTGSFQCDMCLPMQRLARADVNAALILAGSFHIKRFLAHYEQVCHTAI